MNDTEDITKVKSDNKLITGLDLKTDEILQPYFSHQDSIGLSVGLYCHNTAHFYNYGELQKGTGLLPTPDTVFEIGSITKTFTAALLGIAVAKNLLFADDLIIDHLPDEVAENPSLKNITFKQLANHTSGLPRVPEDLLEIVSDPEQPYADYSRKTLFSYLKDFEGGSKPGTEYEYSNLGFGLLGTLLEKVFSESYEQLLQKYIFDSIGLADTSFKPDYDNPVAQGYNEQEEAVPMWDFKSLKAAGAIKSTCSDLLKYGIAQLCPTNPLLDKAMALTHYMTFENGRNFVGLGWQYLAADKRIIFHSGSTGGFCSSLFVDLNDHIVVALLANGKNSLDAYALGLMGHIKDQARKPLVRA